MHACTCRYVRMLRLPGGVPPHLLTIGDHMAWVVVHSQVDQMLHAFTVNGRHTGSEETDEVLSALVPSPDGRFLLSAGERGVVSLRWFHSLQV